MTIDVLKYLIKFIVLVLVQVLILNNIQFLGFVNPYLYIVFILTLPVALSVEATMGIAFLLGLCIDVFSNTLGMHAFACVMIAFLRKWALSFFEKNTGHNIEHISIPAMGSGNFMRYIVLLTLIHHTALFVMNAFTFFSPWLLFFRIVCSSIFTILLIWGLELFKSK